MVSWGAFVVGEGCLPRGVGVGRTLLGEDVKALLHQQRGVEDNQAIAQREDVVARADFEEGTDGALLPGPGQHTTPARPRLSDLIVHTGDGVPHTSPSICSRSNGELIPLGRTLGRAPSTLFGWVCCAL